MKVWNFSRNENFEKKFKFFVKEENCGNFSVTLLQAKETLSYVE